MANKWCGCNEFYFDILIQHFDGRKGIKCKNCGKIKWDGDSK